MKLTFWDFVKDQCATLPEVVKTDLSEKTIIVTGANAGLGFEAAKHFATMSPGKLIITCRTREKGEETVARESTYICVVALSLPCPYFSFTFV